MPLAAGVRLGSYEIVSPLGAGGMGEVYRARDSKLNRDVALKVLPEAFALDQERLARFKREAQVLASLNHPNIAAIYGFEDTGSTHALVLELVEGPTLAGRIAQGAIPLDEAVPIAMQIADALEAAHEQGIIHRDLKPANIKLRPDGTVKVLDFGLAKALDPPSALSPNVTNSPTITSPAMMTGLGVLLGTAAYMSPEQAMGRAADKRADIWAFGVVLYEMLTGAKLFAGETISHTLASVLQDTPDLSLVPLRVCPLLASCLEKDPKKRLRDIGDSWRLLDGAAGTDGGPRSLSRSSRVGLIAALGAALVFAGVAAWLATRPAAPVRTTALTVGFDAAHALTPPQAGRSVAISPDGRRIAYVGPNNALLIRSLDQLEPSVLVRDALVMSPFFSPDGLWVGYFNANRALRKVQIAGGPSTSMTAFDDGDAGGATWAADGAVVLATHNRATGLLLLKPGSSSVTVLTTPNRQANEGDHLWPEFLPGGRAVLFTILPVDGTLENAQVAVCDIRTGVYRVVVPGGTDAHYLPSGHLVFSASGVLRVIAFDLEKLQATGPSTPLSISVLTTDDGAANFDLAADGTFVYVPGTVRGQARRQLVWIGRDGAEEALGAPERAYGYPRLSPDGSRVLLDIRDQDNDIWLFDLRRGTLTNLTRSPALDRFPLWTPDGKSFIFASDREGKGNALYRQSAEGAGDVERLSDSTTEQQVADAFSSDGKQLIMDLGTNLMILALDGTRRMSPVLQTPSVGPRAALAADGRSLAYMSNESGKTEIYVSPFPNVKGGRTQVSVGGGLEPWWSRARSELFYFTPGGALMSAQVNATSVSRPAVVFEPRSFFYIAIGTAAATFDVSPDGRRLLMIKNIAGDQISSQQMIVVQNWLESVKRLLPAR